MRIICYGAALSGFTLENVISLGAELDDKLEDDEDVVIVAHGYPSVRDPADRSKNILDPDLLRHRLRAVVITHRSHDTSSEELERLKDALGEKCQRIFGLSGGWNNLDSTLRGKVESFLISEDFFPYDADVQRVLGFGAPVARLALRAALEIALAWIPGGARERGNNIEMGMTTLLEPALEIARQEPSLAHVAAGIEKALAGKQETLHEEIRNVLAALSDTPGERN